MAFDDWFVFKEDMDIDRELDSTDFYKNKPAKLYRFRNWDPYTKSDCNMNVKYHKTSSPSFDKKQQGKYINREQTDTVLYW